MMCTKMKFFCRKEAKKYMKSSKDINFTNAYKCPECNQWHLTTMDKRNSRAYTRKLNKL